MDPPESEDHGGRVTAIGGVGFERRRSNGDDNGAHASAGDVVRSLWRRVVSPPPNNNTLPHPIAPSRLNNSSLSSIGSDDDIVSGLTSLQRNLAVAEERFQRENAETPPRLAAFFAAMAVLSVLLHHTTNLPMVSWSALGRLSVAWHALFSPNLDFPSAFGSGQFVKPPSASTCSPEPCLLVATPFKDEPLIYLGGYVDDFAYYSKSDKVEAWFQQELSAQIRVDFMGDLQWFLGCCYRWEYLADGRLSCHVSQEAHCEHLLQRFERGDLSAGRRRRP